MGPRECWRLGDPEMDMLEGIGIDCGRKAAEQAEQAEQAEASMGLKLKPSDCIFWLVSVYWCFLYML